MIDDVNCPINVMNVKALIFLNRIMNPIKKEKPGGNKGTLINVFSTSTKKFYEKAKCLNPREKLH